MHALTDALYGALAEGDIGQHFPPSDPQWKGAESHVFLRHAMARVATRGYIMANCAVLTVGGIGFLRPASGTWASALAVAVGLLLHGLGGFPLLAIAMIAATGLGFWACARGVEPGTDPSEVVIDEVAGQWLTLCFPSAAFWGMGLDHFPYPGWVAAFVFFRVFDIWKPWLIGRADRRGDSVGVMLDDLLAGIAAGIAVILSAGLAHGVLM